MSECPPLDLGGRTLASPCLGPLGLCTPWDYFGARKQLQTVRNGLVTRINAYIALVKAKKAKWTPALDAAYILCNETSWNVLAEHTESNWHYIQLQESRLEATRLFVDMSLRCHAASCDVDAALAAAGVVPPSMPGPPATEKSIVDKVADSITGAAKGLGKFGAVALALWGGVQLLRSRERES